MKRLAVLLILLNTSAFADDFIIDEPGSVQPRAVPQAPASPQPQQNTWRPAVRAPMNPPLSIGSVQTPDSLAKGRYRVDFTMYDTGGVNTRLIVGIFDVLAIGITENFDGLIGSGDIQVNIPGAYIKLNVLRDFYNFNWAVGFDSFAIGQNGSWFDTNNRPNTMYGFFTSLGWRYSLFGQSDIFSFGYRIPLLPGEVRDITNSSFCMAASGGISPQFRLGLTVENIYADFTRTDRILPGMIISFLPSPEFTLSLNLQYEFYSRKLNRILSIAYESSF